MWTKFIMRQSDIGKKENDGIATIKVVFVKFLEVGILVHESSFNHRTPPAANKL